MNSAYDVSGRPSSYVPFEEVAATARKDIKLFELNELMMRLYHSDKPEAVRGSLAALLKPLDQLGLIVLGKPDAPSAGQPLMATRACPPSVLLHFFWGDWLPAYYKHMNQRDSQQHRATPAICTVVLELPDDRPNLADLAFELSLRLEVSGVAEIRHIESGDLAAHRTCFDMEVKP